MPVFFEYIKDPATKTLVETLSGLMEQQPLDEISTTDLIAHSGISRSTFYRRFSDKYDLLNKACQELLDDALQGVSQGETFRSAFFRLYEAVLPLPSFFKNALSSNNSGSLRPYITAQLLHSCSNQLRSSGLNMNTPYYRMLLIGFIHGAMEVSCQWVLRGMKEPIESLFRVTYELLPHEFQVCLFMHYN